jgi:hypothetical protein
LAVWAALLASGALSAQQDRMVTLDVSVLDDRGEFISNLHANEIQLTDAGRRQQIALFLPEERTPILPVALTHREYSNRRYPVLPQALVVVLDQLTANIEFKNTEWDQILRALRREPSDKRLYLYLLTKTGALLPVHGMPESWVEDAANDALWTRELPPLFDEMRNAYRARPPEGGKEGQDRRGAPGWALAELATQLAAVPGPRAIVWVGATGLGKPVFEAGAVPKSSDNSMPDPIPVYRVGQRGRDLETGDIGKTIARALADQARWYRIGYYPAAGNWDGKFHEIRFASTRPGMHFHAKTGYTAVKPVDVADDLRQSIPDLVPLCPFDASAIEFTVSGESADGMAPLKVRIDTPGLPGPFAAQPVIYHADGQVEALQEPSVFEGREAVVKTQVPRQAAKIRLVVLDRTARIFGTVTLPAGGSFK